MFLLEIYLFSVYGAVYLLLQIIQNITLSRSFDLNKLAIIKANLVIVRQPTDWSFALNLFSTNLFLRAILKNRLFLPYSYSEKLNAPGTRLIFKRPWPPPRQPFIIWTIHCYDKIERKWLESQTRNYGPEWRSKLQNSSTLDCDAGVMKNIAGYFRTVKNRSVSKSN